MLNSEYIYLLWFDSLRPLIDFFRPVGTDNLVSSFTSISGNKRSNECTESVCISTTFGGADNSIFVCAAENKGSMTSLVADSSISCFFISSILVGGAGAGLLGGFVGDKII